MMRVRIIHDGGTFSAIPYTEGDAKSGAVSVEMSDNDWRVYRLCMDDYWNWQEHLLTLANVQADLEKNKGG